MQECNAPKTASKAVELSILIRVENDGKHCSQSSISGCAKPGCSCSQTKTSAPDCYPQRSHSCCGNNGNRIVIPIRVGKPVCLSEGTLSCQSRQNTPCQFSQNSVYHSSQNSVCQPSLRPLSPASVSQPQSQTTVSKSQKQSASCQTLGQVRCTPVATTAQQLNKEASVVSSSAKVVPKPSQSKVPCPRKVGASKSTIGTGTTIKSSVHAQAPHPSSQVPSVHPVQVNEASEAQERKRVRPRSRSKERERRALERHNRQAKLDKRIAKDRVEERREDRRSEEQRTRDERRFEGRKAREERRLEERKAREERRLEERKAREERRLEERKAGERLEEQREKRKPEESIRERSEDRHERRRSAERRARERSENRRREKRSGEERRTNYKERPAADRGGTFERQEITLGARNVIQKPQIIQEILVTQEAPQTQPNPRDIEAERKEQQKSEELEVLERLEKVMAEEEDLLEKEEQHAERRHKKILVPPEQLKFSDIPPVVMTYVDYFLKVEGGSRRIFNLAQAKEKYEAKCKSMLSNVSREQKTNAERFFGKITETLTVKFPDTGHTEISHFQPLKYLTQIMAELGISAEKELHSIEKYHDYILLVAANMEDRLIRGETLNPTALVDIETQLLAGIISRFYPLFIKLKDFLVMFSVKPSAAIVTPEDFILKLRKVLLTADGEILSIETSFMNVLPKLNLPNPIAEEKYRKGIISRRTHAKHSVSWAARCLATALLYYYLNRENVTPTTPRRKS